MAIFTCNNISMGDFNRGGRSGGRSDGGQGGRGRDFGRGGRGDFGGTSGRPNMYKAICSDCKKECEVPFRPSGDKPVYCSDCFRNTGGSSDRRDFGRKEFRGRDRGGDRGRSDFGEKRMFHTVCTECGKDCEVPFRPSGDKPVYCNNCFGKDDGFKPKKTDDNKQEFERLNAKLDRLIKALESKGLMKEVVIEKPEVVVTQEQSKELPEKANLKKKEMKKKVVEKKSIAKKAIKAKKKSK